MPLDRRQGPRISESDRPLPSPEQLERKLQEFRESHPEVEEEEPTPPKTSFTLRDAEEAGQFLRDTEPTDIPLHRPVENTGHLSDPEGD